MTAADLLRLRLRNQRVSGAPLGAPQEVVSWLGAVQAQDYAGAKWTVAQRTAGVTDAAMDEALASATLIRTHVMRPTWHFVPPADIRWMLALTAPRVNTMCRSYFRRMNLDDRVFERSGAVLARALRGGRTLTRSELASALRDAGVTSSEDSEYRFTFIVMRAELDAVICSGPRIGKQFTYALLDERVPRGPALDRSAARAELAWRYFRSHGPATLRDFVWWSGLTTADARAGIESIRSELASECIGATVYWRAKRARSTAAARETAYLLPTYDECLVAYRDRPSSDAAAMAGMRRDRGQLLVIGDVVVGTWRRVIHRGAIRLLASPVRSFTRAQRAALEAAAERYARFAGAPVALSIS